MPKKKDVVKAGTPVRFRENSRIMRAHETMVDLISGRTAGGSFMDALANGILSLDILRGLDEELENEIIYSDDESNDRFYPAMASNKALAPHPRIRQLTDEEADRHARELIEEEERRKEKMEKNKRKKKRKKEKKRQEKENAVKDILPEEEQGKSDSSENQEESSNIESKAEATESPESSKTQNESEIPECDESSERNKEENPMKMNKKEEDDDDEEQKDLNLNNSYASTADSVPVETRNQTAATERETENGQLPEIQQPEAEKPKDVEEPEVEKKKEEKQETIKEKTMDPTAEEYAKRSRELAGVGNRLAASGQYGMAVKCFTDAIKYNPTEFKLFGNRSLCYERMQQYENALRDADLALSMEPNWVKGLFRKGKALCGLKRYYEASLVYKEVLNLDSTSLEATQELKRAQTLHLMEMGFSWAQSSQALKTHPTLEEAVEALFGSHPSIPRDVAASRDNVEPPVVQQEGEEEDGQWIVCGLQTTRPRTHQIKESDGVGQSRSNSLSPTPLSKSSVKPELFPIWVGSLAPAVTYATLHELFSRAGTVYSIKMLLEHQCAFVNYTRKEDCDRAIQCINGMVVEGAPLSVRYPNKIPVGLGMSKSAATEPTARPSTSMFKKECFFWRTTGCTRQDCTYKHVPEHKNIDKEKFTSRLASNHV